MRTIRTYGTSHKNLTFSEEFCACSAWKLADGCAEWCGFSARVPRIFRAGRRRFSVQIWVENGGNQKANFVCDNAEGSRNMSQGSFEVSLSGHEIWITQYRKHLRIMIIATACYILRILHGICELFHTQPANFPCGHTWTAARLNAEFPAR